MPGEQARQHPLSQVAIRSERQTQAPSGVVAVHEDLVTGHRREPLWVGGARRVKASGRGRRGID